MTTTQLTIRTTFFCIGMMLGSLLFPKIDGKKTDTQVVHVRDTVVAYQKMSDWQILQLAIMAVESRYDTHAEGGHDARGVFQITPVYVRECNRILGGETYTHADAYDLQKSVQMFGIMQARHNPGRDFQEAIRLHNPGGKSIGYPDKVVQAYNEIVRYERAREAVR